MASARRSRASTRPSTGGNDDGTNSAARTGQGSDRVPASKRTVPAFAAVRPEELALAPSIEVRIEPPDGPPRTLVVDRERVRIGTHESNEVVLADEQVSRFHCELVHGGRGDVWDVRDCGSLNGTRVGGVRIRDAELPRPEAVISAGATLLHVKALASSRSEKLSSAITFGGLHGHSAVMRKLFAMIERVAATDATVLVEGESGAGKELVATELVRRSPRAAGPLVVVDCGAISPQLMESTLFGHARGAFTGADREREGAFEAATGGTILLDEIGELPIEMQPRLLRAIESRTVCRIGETRRRPIDVRIIAATNRQLAREMNQGRFREDLFFRLSVVTLRVPSLRERIEDLDLLVRSIIEGLGARGTEHLFPRELLSSMEKYDWPGNVRELRNFVERTVIMRQAGDLAPDSTTRADDRELGATAEATSSRVSAVIDVGQPFRQAKESLIASFEQKYISALLRANGGNITQAARVAHMDRINLHRLVQRHGLRHRRSIED